MKRKNINTKIIIILLSVVVVVLCFSFFILKKDDYKKVVKKKDISIRDYYNKYVKTKAISNLYKSVDGKYIKIGEVSGEVEFTLKDIKNYDSKYFEIKGFNYFISYKDVLKIDNISFIDKRFESYIPFNENVKTKDSFKLYKDNKLVFKLNYSLDLPIILKDDDGVYISFNDDLYFVKNEDIDNIYENINTSLDVLEELPITVYHFIYLNGEVCDEVICHHEDQIKSHFEYLKNNNYFTLTTNEVYLWNEGKIRLPKKSILITIDDGARAEKFIPFLEEYSINATLFLVTSWYNIDTFKSSFLEIASHTDNLHNPGMCSGGQGSPLKCLEMNELVSDLKISHEKTGSYAFCFPFYEYNNHAIEAVKNAGFKMAFVGGQKKMKQGSDSYLIPRITLFSNTTMEEYIDVIS